MSYISTGGGGASGTYLIPAGENKTWYVSATGSDSNDGLTPGTAFATHQHALNTAALYDYQNAWFPTIITEDGTYLPVAADGYVITLPIIANTIGGTPGVIQCNPSNPANVLFEYQSAAAFASQLWVGVGLWQVDGFKADIQGAVYFGNQVNVGNDVICQDVANSGALFFANGSVSVNPFVTITLLATALGCLCQTQAYGGGEISDCSVIMQPNTVFGSGSVLASGYSQVSINATTFTNTATCTSPGITCYDVGAIISPLNYLGAVGAGNQFGFPEQNPEFFLDATSTINGGQIGQIGFGNIHNVPGPPILYTQNWSVWKNTNFGNGVGTQLAFLDDTVQVTAFLEPPAQIASPSSGGTVTINPGVTRLILTPSATLASLTIDLPIDMMDQEPCRISSSQTITALALATTDGSTIFSSPSTLLANTGFTMLYTIASKIWYVSN